MIKSGLLGAVLFALPLLAGCLDERASTTYPPEHYTIAVLRTTDYPEDLRRRLVLAYQVLPEVPTIQDKDQQAQAVWVDTWSRAGFWGSNGRVELYDYRTGALSYSAECRAGFFWTGSEKAVDKAMDALFQMLRSRLPAAELAKRAPGLAAPENQVLTLP